MTATHPIRFSPDRESSPHPLAKRLRREVDGDVLFDRASRGRYATDASIYQIEPVGVVVPNSGNDLGISGSSGQSSCD